MSQEKEILIDKYFKNELSNSDKTEFENLLNTDITFKEEFDFQKNIVSGIKLARKNELKARLNKIEIPTSNNNTYLKIAAFVALILSLGWLFWYSTNTVETITETSSDTTSNIAVAEKVEEPNNSVIKNDAPEKTSTNKTTTEKLVFEGNSPELPNEVNFNDENLDKSIKSDDNDLSKKVDIDRKALTIITNGATAYKFHYQYNEKSITLFGDFENKKYEVIQYNNAVNPKLYIYINSNFFEIETNSTTIKPLVEISDSDKISELKQRL